MQRFAARRAFTLVEALVSTAITAVASAAVLLGIANSIDATDANLQQTLAMGMAQQLMDEIAAQRYCEASGNPYATTLGLDSGESAGPGRSQFDDIDDYNGYRCQPPVDRFGVALGQDNGQGGARHASFQSRGGYFSRWRQQVDVYYVDNANPSQALSGGSTSNYRAVRVTILVDDPVRGPLGRAQLTRVFAYVPGS
jgi:type II secretory pathway pseudopilin PulG